MSKVALVVLTVCVIFILGFNTPKTCSVVWESDPFIVGKGGCPDGSFGVGIKNLSQGLCVRAVAVCD